MKNKKNSFLFLIFFLILILFFYYSHLFLQLKNKNKVNNKSIIEKNKTNSDIKIETKIVNGTSLSPYIKNNQKIKVLINYYKNHKIKRNDVIIFNYSNNKNPLIKIIKAIPGDKWNLKKINNFYLIIVNNRPLKNFENKTYKIPLEKIQMLKLYVKSYPTIPNDTYLILGNKISGTLDSTVFGLVGKKDIIGKVILN